MSVEFGILFWKLKNELFLHLLVSIHQTMTKSQMWTKHFLCFLFLKEISIQFFLTFGKIYTPKFKIHDHNDIILFVYQIQRFQVPFFKLKSICTYLLLLRTSTYTIFRLDTVPRFFDPIGHQSTSAYRTRAIITRSLYTFYPLFEVHLCTVTFGLMYG